VEVLRIILQVVCALTSAFMVLFILMHKGRGGGLSDMFGGGVASSAGSSGVAEKNLNRITIAVAVIWTISIILQLLIARFFSS
jgi:preprotein translocase subunit SecG